MGQTLKLFELRETAFITPAPEIIFNLKCLLLPDKCSRHFLGPSPLIFHHFYLIILSYFAVRDHAAENHLLH